MEIFDRMLPILIDLTAMLTAHFDGPHGALQALALAGVAVILLLFVVARRQGQATQRSVASASEPVVLNELVPNAELNGEFTPARLAGNLEADALAAVAAKKDAKDTATPEDGKQTEQMSVGLCSIGGAKTRAWQRRSTMWIRGAGCNRAGNAAARQRISMV